MAISPLVCSDVALNVGKAMSLWSNSIKASFELSLDYGRGDHFGSKIHCAEEAGGAREDRGGAGQDDGVRLETQKSRREARRDPGAFEEEGIGGRLTVLLI